MSEQQQFVVEGMTCDHCVRAVTSEVGAVSGVESVDVDLSSGRLTIAGSGVEVEAVRAAVVEAGYALV